jgi:hypothetical protein
MALGSSQCDVVSSQSPTTNCIKKEEIVLSTRLNNFFFSGLITSSEETNEGINQNVHNSPTNYY